MFGSNRTIEFRDRTSSVGQVRSRFCLSFRIFQGVSWKWSVVGVYRERRVWYEKRVIELRLVSRPYSICAENLVDSGCIGCSRWKWVQGRSLATRDRGTATFERTNKSRDTKGKHATKSPLVYSYILLFRRISRYLQIYLATWNAFLKVNHLSSACNAYY